EGTSSELGRVMSWVTLDTAGPREFSVSLRLRDLESPRIVAERLPKALIHRNIPGERVHSLIEALHRAWARASAHAPYGPRQRWLAATEGLRVEGWEVLTRRHRARLGELTVPWEQVRPEGF